jgi:hypothetical protein
VSAGPCLDAQALAALSAAPVGQAPPALAAHLAGCSRCQDRLLAMAAGPRAGRRETARVAPWRNLVIMLVAIVLVIVTLGVALGMLRGNS